jgi:hypothetical protein
MEIPRVYELKLLLILIMLILTVKDTPVEEITELPSGLPGKFAGDLKV